MKGKGKLSVSLTLNGQDCGEGFTAEDCDAAAEVFRRATEAIRAREYGLVEVLYKFKDGSVQIVASVGLDYSGIEFDDKKGLPKIWRKVVRGRR